MYSCITCVIYTALDTLNEVQCWSALAVKTGKRLIWSLSVFMCCLLDFGGKFGKFRNWTEAWVCAKHTHSTHTHRHTHTPTNYSNTAYLLEGLYCRMQCSCTTPQSTTRGTLHRTRQLHIISCNVNCHNNFAVDHTLTCDNNFAGSWWGVGQKPIHQFTFSHHWNKVQAVPRALYHCIYCSRKTW